MSKLYENIKIRRRKEELSSQEYSQTVKLIKGENYISILSSLEEGVIIEFLKISSNSENIYFYTCEKDQQIIGYAILAKEPRYLISEFYKIRFLILKNLVKKLKIQTIANLILSFSGLDLILFSKKNKNLMNESLNLNMLAVKKEYQSKGIGNFFLKNIISDINKSKSFNILSVESFDRRAIDFYKKRFDFKLMGKKIRFFKNLYILFKSL